MREKRRKRGGAPQPTRTTTTEQVLTDPWHLSSANISVTALSALISAATAPGADVVVRSHSEGVAAGRVQSCQFTVSLAPKVTFSEDAVLLSLQRQNRR